MNANSYLLAILRKNILSDIERQKLIISSRPIYREIRKWAGPYLLDIIPSGSFAKGTLIKSSMDIDLLISLKNDTPRTLKEIYESLFSYFDSEMNARKQNVSIGVHYNGIKIDLVPAKRMPAVSYPHSIYIRKGDTWQKTNIHTHIKLIKESPYRNIIILLKVWRELRGLEFPSFLLELVVLEALKRKRALNFEDRITEVLRYLVEEFETARIIDPANTTNIVSDDLDDDEKEKIVRYARNSYDAKYWEEIIWGLYDKK